MASIPPSIKAFDAVSCPPVLTLKLLADITKSPSVVDDDKIKLLLDIDVVPISNPPIEPVPAFNVPSKSPLVAVILPLKSTLEAVILPAFETLKF